MRTVAFIPARGGSKGLPGKNIKLLLGNPLIHYTIEAALECARIDAVYVSTDDPAIAEISHEAGALLPPLRPADLAQDTTSSLEVVRFFLDWYGQTWGEQPETLILLQPTSPLRHARHLAEAMALYDHHYGHATVVSVTTTKPLSWQGWVDDSGFFHSYRTTDFSSNRQAEAPNYVLNGALYIAPSSRFASGRLMEAGVMPYVMPPEVSVDIDTATDFLLAERLMRERNENSAQWS